jgi:hypothetical protein
VASLPVLTETLATQLASRELTRAQAERIMSLSHLASAGAPCEPRTWHRRRREFRARGLVVANGLFQPVEVGVAGVLETLDSPAWGQD